LDGLVARATYYAQIWLRAQAIFQDREMNTTNRPSTPTARRQQRGASTLSLADSFTHRLHTLGKLTDKATQAAYLAEAGLPLGEGRCLAAVGAFAPLSVKDLARMANVDKGQASRAAQSLVDKGLVRKTPSAADARGVVLGFTDAGAALWRRLMTVIARRNHEIVACLSAEEQAQFDVMLSRLVQHARALADEP
jgi:DNA-binding MarR family transcriptional regulator